MPCRDWDENIRVVREPDPKTEAQLKGVSALLCAVMSALEKRSGGEKEAFTWLQKSVDWEEAGVCLDDLAKWWSQHKYLDMTRREQEKANKAREEARKARQEAKEEARKVALAKLSPEDLRALGVSPDRPTPKANSRLKTR